MKHNRDPETEIVSCTEQTNLCGRLQSPDLVFDLHFDRFDGFIFEAEKPFENVCAIGASQYCTHRAVVGSRFPSTMPLHLEESFEYRFHSRSM